MFYNKFLFTISLSIGGLSANAQWLWLQPIDELAYSNLYARGKQILIQEPLIYTIRGGGLEYLNTNTQATNYYWADYYQLGSIVQDTGSTYVYLKQNGKYIGRYNAITQKYENIWLSILQNKQVSDIDVAPDGKVWAVTVNVSKEVAIYDGVNWQLFPFPGYIYYGFSHIKVVNDTLAYLHSNYIAAFHNGIYDTLYTFPSGAYFEDWDVDTAGNAWIAARYKLIHLYGGNVTVYDTSNTPLGNDQFLHVKIGTNGHVWTAGNKNKLMDFDGSTWQVKTLPYSNNIIENFSLDKQNNPWVVASYSYTHPLYKYNGSGFSSIPFPFMPIKQAKSIGSGYSSYANFATNEGIFNVNTYNFFLNGFSDSSLVPYANDVTCFTDNEINFYPSFGTHEGVYSLTGFSNTQLPNTNINYIHYYNGSYYIATDSGLVVYNGILYSNINTSNAPLPSDKITFVTTGYDIFCNSTNSLYVGTDKGIAVYQNAQWTVYDTTNIPLSNFYVTGILPQCWDTSIYISTLGDGLVEVYPSGGYNLFNTSNGELLDDTLYYIKRVNLGGCGSYMVMGTSHHGLLYTEDYQPTINFYYDTLDWNTNTPIHSSTMLTVTSYNYLYIVSTDTGYYYLTPCGVVSESNASEITISIYPNPTTGILSIQCPEKIAAIEIMNMLGEKILTRDEEEMIGGGNQSTINHQSLIIDLSSQPNGIYFVKISNDKRSVSKKVVLMK